MTTHKQKLQQEKADLHAEYKALMAKLETEEDLSDEERARAKEINARLDAINGDLELLTKEEERERQMKALESWDGGGLEELGEVTSKEEKETFGDWGEWLRAVYDIGRKGVPNTAELADRLNRYAEASGLNESIDSEGGFLVGKREETTIREKAYETGQILSRVSRLPIGEGFRGVKLPMVDETSRADGSRFGGIRAEWLDEAGKFSGTKPKFALLDLQLRKLGALVYVTDELLEDKAALAAWISQRLPIELTFRAEDAIINGDGVGKPLGVLKSGAVITHTRSGAGAITYAGDVLEMWARIWAPSRRTGVWLVDQSAEVQLYQMALEVGTAGGGPVFLPQGGASVTPYANLFGRPMIPYEYGAALGTSGDILFADLSQYTLIDKGAIKTASSIHVRFEYDEMAFRFVWRLDGKPEWKSALTPKSGGDTVGPFVVLS